MIIVSTSYTTGEVARDNTVDDYDRWRIMASGDSDKKQIYDITSYLQLIAGGSELLEDVVRTDVTDVWSKTYLVHSDIALRAMMRYALCHRHEQRC
jgi:hypothetical protein